jgi:hypothetical protein
LVLEWIIACDQPFDEVEKPEYIAMMEYGRDPSKFSLLKRNGVRQCVMKLGEDTIEATKAMFSVLFPLFLSGLQSTEFV